MAVRTQLVSSSGSLSTIADRETVHFGSPVSTTEVHCPSAPQVSPLPYSPMGEFVSLVSSSTLLSSKSKLDESVVACEPEEVAAVDGLDILNPTASVFQPALFATVTAQLSVKNQESERFLDCLQALVETMQMPIIPKGDCRENPHVTKWREGQVAIYTERMVNYCKLSPENRADTVTWVNDWENYFETHELVC